MRLLARRGAGTYAGNRRPPDGRPRPGAGDGDMFGRLFRRKPADAGRAAGEAAGPEADEVPELVAVDLVRIGGPPELDFLLIGVPAVDIHRALDGWVWIGLGGLTAVSVSAFGEIFFRDEAGRIVQLDTIEGRLRPVADSLAAFTAMLQETEARDDLLLGGFVIAAREQGLLLDEGECYDFVVAPVVGGEMSAAAMQKLSFVIKLHLAGQLHEQVKDLPPGTPITGFSIAD